MANKNNYSISYTSNSLNGAKEIVDYLEKQFSKKELDKFYQLLSDFEKIIILYPTLYPKSNTNEIRKAVLSKELSVFFVVRKFQISVVAITDNRWLTRNKSK